MKQFSIVRNQLFVGSLILSIVLSACSSRDSSLTSNASRVNTDAAQMQPVPASNAMAGNTAMSGNTSMTGTF
ncbi:MAG TPA: hypothetical protein VF692_15665, partial [Pyrinomonadaceae bacterium]